ncbi:MAG: hypothetical protein ACOYON_13485 [Fimbriimonas sp.]
MVLVRLATEAYLLTLGWAMVSIPLFGLIVLFFPLGPVVQVVGWIALTWPLTIPMRGYLVSYRLAKRYGKPHRLRLDGEWLLVAPDSGEQGVKLKLDSIRSVRKRGDWAVVLTRSLKVLVVPARTLAGTPLLPN